MNRIDELQKEMDKMRLILDDKNTKQKKFKFPRRLKSASNKAEKKDEYIAVQYLTAKYGVKFKLCKLVQGNLIVINNKVHEINPKALWRYGKYRWYIHREIDRKPVSNLDYNLVKRRRDDTEADVPLIKAVLGAVQKPNPLQNKGIWILIAIVVIVGVLAWVFLGGKAG